MKSRLTVLGALLLVAIPAAGSSDISTAYLAPVNRVVYRLTLPGGVRDFRGYDASDHSLMTSSDGWSLRFGVDGKSASVCSPAKDVRYEFDRGRLIRCVDASGESNFPYDLRRGVPPDVMTPLAFYQFEDGYFEQQTDRMMAGKWRGSNRLCFPDANPNRSGAFYTLLALLGVAFLATANRRLRFAGIALSGLSCIALILTGSRGSMLGLAVGLVPFAIAFRLSFLRSRWFWIASALVLALLVVWLGVVNSGSLTRGFTSTGVDWGNAVRLDMWKTAPRMMVDAPSGWLAAGPGSGRAYFDWYEPFDEILLTGNLMNDHLTVLADIGWGWRFGYVFLVALLLAASTAVLWRHRDGFPLAVFLSLAAMAWFNPVYGAWTTWPVPLVASAVLLHAAVRKSRALSVVGVIGISAVLAGLSIAAIYQIGSRTAIGGIRVKADGPRVLLQSGSPSVWVVDDEQGALGAMFAGHDVREFYRTFPDAPAIGYVRDISSLPARPIARLVLSGKAAQDWLLLLSENESARRNLPREVIMISPPFAPSEIPQGVIACCHPRVYVGEFAARFQPEYADPPAFVTVLPSMERYIFGWMRLAVGD